jgi:hypothetical protein
MDGIVFGTTSGMSQVCSAKFANPRICHFPVEYVFLCLRSQAKKVKKFVKVLQLAAERRGDATFTVPEMAQLAQQHHINVAR